MLITCTNCATSYEVAASSLGPSGRSVRCARCQHMWFAANTDAMADVAEAHRADLATIGEVSQPPESTPEFPPAAPPEAAEVAQPLTDEADVSPPAWPAPAPDDSPAPPVIEAPPLVPAAPTTGEDIESVAARRDQRHAAHRRRWERSRWIVAILTLLAIHLMLI